MSVRLFAWSPFAPVPAALPIAVRPQQFRTIRTACQTQQRQQAQQ